MTTPDQPKTEAPESPKLAGPHRRLVRPGGELSGFLTNLSITLVVIALALFLAILYWMR